MFEFSFFFFSSGTESRSFLSNLCKKIYRLFLDHTRERTSERWSRISGQINAKSREETAADLSEPTDKLKKNLNNFFSHESPRELMDEGQQPTTYHDALTNHENSLTMCVSHARESGKIIFNFFD